MLMISPLHEMILIFSNLHQQVCEDDQFLENQKCKTECSSQYYYYSLESHQNICIQTKHILKYFCDYYNECQLNCVQNKSNQFMSSRDDKCVKSCSLNEYYFMNKFKNKQCISLEEAQQINLKCGELSKICVPQCNLEGEHVSFTSQTCTDYRLCTSIENLGKSQYGVYQHIVEIPEFGESFCTNNQLEVQDILEKSYKDPKKTVIYQYVGMFTRTAEDKPIDSYTYRVVNECPVYVEITYSQKILDNILIEPQYETLQKDIIYVCATQCKKKVWELKENIKYCYFRDELCQSKVVDYETNECVQTCPMFYAYQKNGIKYCYNKCPFRHKRDSDTSFLCIKKQNIDTVIISIITLTALLIVLLFTFAILKKRKQQIRQRFIIQKDTLLI